MGMGKKATRENGALAFVAASARATDPRVSARFFSCARAIARCFAAPWSRCLWRRAHTFFPCSLFLYFYWSREREPFSYFLFLFSLLGFSACCRVRFGRCRGYLPPRRSARRQPAKPPSATRAARRCFFLFFFSSLSVPLLWSGHPHGGDARERHGDDARHKKTTPLQLWTPRQKQGGKAYSKKKEKKKGLRRQRTGANGNT